MLLDGLFVGNAVSADEGKHWSFRPESRELAAKWGKVEATRFKSFSDLVQALNDALNDWEGQ